MSSGEGVAGGAGDPWSNDEPGTGAAAESATAPESTAELEADIEAVRRQMSDVAGELQRRGDEVASVARRWTRRLAPVAGGLVVLAAAGLTYRYWRSRRRAATPARWWSALRSVQPREALDELRTRVSRAIAPAQADRPHRLRDAGLKVGTAALGAAASMAGKQLARKLIASRGAGEAGGGGGRG